MVIQTFNPNIWKVEASLQKQKTKQERKKKTKQKVVCLTEFWSSSACVPFAGVRGQFLFQWKNCSQLGLYKNWNSYFCKICQSSSWIWKVHCVIMCLEQDSCSFQTAWEQCSAVSYTWQLKYTRAQLHCQPGIDHLALPLEFSHI